MHISKIEVPLSLLHNLLPDDQNLAKGHKLITRGLHPKESRYLYRIDGHVVLVQTHLEPDWSSLTEEGYICLKKPFNPNFIKDQMFRFRARLNACKSVPSQGTRGKIVGIGGEENQVVWLRQKAEKAGFSVRDVAARDERMKKDVERKGLIFRSVLFEGVLRVNDPEAFQDTIASGFGRGKAFGFGMISLAT